MDWTIVFCLADPTWALAVLRPPLVPPEAAPPLEDAQLFLGIDIGISATCEATW